MILAAIFDMDGLLIDSEPFWRKAEKEGFAEFGLQLTDADCRSTMGYRLNEVVQKWLPNESQERQLEAEHRIISLITNYILNEAQPMPGVHDAIAICRKAGLKTAIASSSPMKLIETVVQRFDLKSSFALLHSAEVETHGKPHPAVFMHAADKLQCQPSECLVFEDSFHGMVAALAAKMKVIAIPDADSRNLPKFRAADFLLESLLDFSSDLLRKCNE